MDTSTATFFAAVVVVIIVLRRFINEPTAGTTGPVQAPATVRRARPVTQDMIEIVQAIAPTLTAAQIRYDLERTGNVEETIDKYLAQGTLPFPPGYVEPSASTATSSSTSASSDLISRYGLSEKVANNLTSAEPLKPKWSDSKEERQAQLKRHQQEMILQARRKLASKDS